MRGCRRPPPSLPRPPPPSPLQEAGSRLPGGTEGGRGCPPGRPRSWMELPRSERVYLGAAIAAIHGGGRGGGWSTCAPSPAHPEGASCAQVAPRGSPGGPRGGSSGGAGAAGEDGAGRAARRRRRGCLCRPGGAGLGGGDGRAAERPKRGGREGSEKPRGRGGAAGPILPEPLPSLRGSKTGSESPPARLSAPRTHLAPGCRSRALRVTEPAGPWPRGCILARELRSCRAGRGGGGGGAREGGGDARGLPGHPPQRPPGRGGEPGSPSRRPNYAPAASGVGGNEGAPLAAPPPREGPETLPAGGGGSSRTAAAARGGSPLFLPPVQR